MSVLKKLAGQTAIYGVSSILGRLLNFVLLPLHTYVFMPEAMGVVTDLYASVAFLNVLYTYGMETAFFRHVGDHGKKTFETAASSLLLSSTAFSLLLWLVKDSYAAWFGYPEQGLYIGWLALIVWIDAILALPFARLRQQNQARRFATYRIISIVAMVFFNAFFLLLCKPVAEGNLLPGLQTSLGRLYSPEIGVGYIFLSNLLGNGLLLLVSLPAWRGFRLAIDPAIWKKMMLYALPILLTGIAGIANENLDKILFKTLLPDDFYAAYNAQGALGVYGATFKLSVFMMLAIQAFRYAGEPFFFNQAKSKDAPELFAKVLHYFYLTGLILFVGVSINLDLLAQLFLRQKIYHDALYVVPWLLYAKLLFGVYVNLSIWYKLKNKTIYGTYITVAGMAITVLGDVLLIPRLGFMGAAIANLACYALMVFLCYQLGKRYFSVPYRFAPLLVHTLAAVLLIYLVSLLPAWGMVIDTTLHLLIALGYVGMLYLTERKNLFRATL